MKYNEWKIKKITSINEGHGGRHQFQNSFYTKLLLETFEKQFPECLSIEVTTEFEKMVTDAAHNLRVHYGFEWDKSKQEAQHSKAYQDFISNLLLHKYLSTTILLYRSRNLELAVRFPNQKMRNTFVSKIGGYVKQSDGKLFPFTFSDNPTTLYIPGYIAKNGELAASFPDTNMRKKFCRILKLLGTGIVSIYDHQLPIYFNDRSIHLENYSIKIPIPSELENCDRKELISTFFSTTPEWKPQDLTQIITDYDHDCGKEVCYLTK